MKNWNTLTPDVTRLMNRHYTPGRAGHTVEMVVMHHNAGTGYGRTAKVRFFVLGRAWRDGQSRRETRDYEQCIRMRSKYFEQQ